MWRKLRRRTFAPSRPLLYPEQLGLVLFTAIALGSGIYLVLHALL